MGVDKALAFASQPYIDACVTRYPERFAGVVVFDHLAEDLEEQIASYRSRPGCLAGRNLVANAATAELSPELKTFWTFSLWDNREHLDAFAREDPHRQIIGRLRPLMEQTRFEFFPLAGRELPWTWEQMKAPLQSG